jgi:hypothetical protein
MAMNFPTPSYVGQQYSNGFTTYQWDGTGWNIVPQMGPIFIGDNPPANPAIGQEWWRSSNGQLYIWFVDAGGPPGQWVQSAGGSVGGRTAFKLLTTSGSYTKPDGLVALDVWCVGGGGGGSRAGITAATTSSAGGGGGGGGACRKLYAATDLAASEPYVIGAGGLSPSGVGAAGGATTFKGQTANGGGGGGGLMTAQSNFGVSNFGSAGVSSGGDLNLQGETGTQGIVNANQAAFGGACGGGGASHFAAGRPGLWGGFANSLIGYAGVFPGGGAAGDWNGNSQSTAGAGNVGGAGCIMLTEYY